MAGKSDTFEQDILKFVLNATPIANIGDNAATAPLTSLFLALHTADPLTGATESGTQSTSEVAYTGYTRLPILRNNGTPAWSVSTDGAGLTKAFLAAVQNFPQCTGTGGGTPTATHFSVGVASSGATKILYAGALSPSIAITTGVTPQLNTSSYIQED